MSAAPTPDHPNPGVPALDHHDGFFGARETRVVVGAAGVELLPKEGLASRAVPARAGKLVCTRVRVSPQQKALVGRKGRTKRKNRRDFRGLFHGRWLRADLGGSQPPSGPTSALQQLSPTVRAAIYTTNLKS
jgi:hypothetical protein